MLDDLDTIECYPRDWYEIYNTLLAVTLEIDAHKKFNSHHKPIAFLHSYHLQAIEIRRTLQHNDEHVAQQIVDLKHCLYCREDKEEHD